MAIRIWNPRNPRRTPSTSMNPSKRRQQANPSQARAELLEQIRELRQENDQLQDQLDKIVDLAEPPDDQNSETIDDLKEKLNQIANTAAPSDDKADDSEDDDGAEDEHAGND